MLEYCYKILVSHAIQAARTNKTGFANVYSCCSASDSSGSLQPFTLSVLTFSGFFPLYLSYDILFSPIRYG